MHALQERFQSAEHDCRQYLNLLDQERDALAKQDVEALEQLLEQKRPLTDALITHDQQIQRYCQANQISPEGLGEHIAQSGDATLEHQYQQFLAALAECKQANEHNARLVHHSQHSTRTILDLLRNQGEPSSGIYDQLGNRSRSGITRDLSKA
ncbi:hypothetical protein GCM10007421_35790 [Halopseudomonas oceani]|uniref:Flagellar protein FlgN n=1 Tax=Halopseudomonas oceani TaxID=1708783 RepID=A0A2P4EQU8_9GAMM|nr:flagellar protein FlgN [Halopseudomonas oceani]POB00990.1 hypothetical protein C1949_17885 [Halopseudomonas oceani]GGE58017.1 hypothetical protein GCM10007421_35790 [Halopseudomonas oceani]